jgi:hypothetical protein
MAKVECNKCKWIGKEEELFLEKDSSKSCPKCHSIALYDIVETKQVPNQENNVERTLVIFRRWKRNPKSVIAIFPLELGNGSPVLCSSYEHIGQHGACDPGIVCDTIACKDTDIDVIELIHELQSIGYNLTIGKRIPNNAIKVRQNRLRDIKEGVIDYDESSNTYSG